MRTAATCLAPQERTPDASAYWIVEDRPPLACEVCDAGMVEDDPMPTPQGPYWRLRPCTLCGGTGWVEDDSTLITEDDLEDWPSGGGSRPEEEA